MILALGAAAIVPSLMLLWFFHAADVHKEPPRVLWTCFGLGVLTIPLVLLSVWPVASLSGIDTIANPYARGTLDAFVEAAIPEEVFKYLVLLGYAYRHREFDEPMDGIVYGVAASLGFATLENLLYVGSGGMGTAVVRTFTALPGHALTGVVMGYFVGRAKFEAEKRSQLLLAGLAFPIVLHGLYDAPLLILKSFEEIKREPSGGAVALLLLAWLVAFGVEVVWGLRLANRLRQAQLTAIVQQGMPAFGLVSPHSSSRPMVAPAADSHRVKGWIQLLTGMLLGGVGGILTLGLGLVVITNSVEDGGWYSFVVVALLFGLVPLALGIALFRWGLINVSARATTAVPHAPPANWPAPGGGGFPSGPALR